MKEKSPTDRTPSIALVQGASRGIGLALVEAILHGAENARVIATCSNPDASGELKTVAQRVGARLIIKRLDVTEEDSIESVARYVAENDSSIDLLINAAGILHDQAGLAPEKRLQDVSFDNLEKYFRINAVGPLMVAKHFVPLMKKPERAVFASISARVGSIEDNRLGGWYGYRASKAAQNMFTRTLSIELARTNPEMICVGLHPGTVATELSKPFSSRVDPARLFSPRDAAEKLLAVIRDLKPGDTGKVFAYDGSVVPW